jgi:hypothetical protein
MDVAGRSEEAHTGKGKNSPWSQRRPRHDGAQGREIRECLPHGVFAVMSVPTSSGKPTQMLHPLAFDGK